MDNYILRGTVEINGNGAYQVEAPGPGAPESQLSVAAAQTLIAGGVHFITSEVGSRELVATTVIAPSFNGLDNVVFTQIHLQRTANP